jgi:hypothetical protein
VKMKGEALETPSPPYCVGLGQQTPSSALGATLFTTVTAALRLGLVPGVGQPTGLAGA